MTKKDEKLWIVLMVIIVLQLIGTTFARVVSLLLFLYFIYTMITDDEK